MPRGGWNRGEVQITNQDDDSRRKVPIRIARSIALAMDAALSVVFAVVWLVTWAFTKYGWAEWWESMTVMWWLYLVLLLLAWLPSIFWLVRDNLYPKLMNDEWPFASAQLDPLVAGAVTWRNMNERLAAQAEPEYGEYDDFDLDEPVREEMNVMITDKTTRDDKSKPEIRMCRLFSPKGHRGMLAAYCAALVQENEAIRAAFSFEGGNAHHGAHLYHYTREEYGELAAEAERAGLVVRDRKNQPYTLTDRAFAVFGQIAERGKGNLNLLPATTATQEGTTPLPQVERTAPV